MSEEMYGNAWEKFPIMPGELYAAHKEGLADSKFICAPFSSKALDLLLGNEKVDLIYTDPPWDNRIANKFREWAGLDKLPKGGFENLLSGIALMCQRFSDGYIAIEMGMSKMGELTGNLKLAGARQFDMFFPLYGNNIEYCLWIGTFNQNLVAPVWDDNPNGKHSEKDRFIPKFLCRNLKPKRILDMFVGAGTFWPPFIEAEVQCFGLEFNKRKVANVADQFDRYGYKLERLR